MKEPAPLDFRVLSAVTGAKLLIHLLAINRYGYFRDELYFLDCARHLDWGYVDHAPLIAVYARISLLLGGSLPALRILPAIAGAATVLLAVLMARQQGGGRFAQGLAGLCVIAAPIFLGMNGILTMNAF
jgi:4-amino-4-deoxy-L-arabinose transferase-like glycosyltransferase